MSFLYTVSTALHLLMGCFLNRAAFSADKQAPLGATHLSVRREWVRRFAVWASFTESFRSSLMTHRMIAACWASSKSTIWIAKLVLRSCVASVSSSSCIFTLRPAGAVMCGCSHGSWWLCFAVGVQLFRSPHRNVYPDPDIPVLLEWGAEWLQRLWLVSVSGRTQMDLHTVIHWKCAVCVSLWLLNYIIIIHD